MRTQLLFTSLLVAAAVVCSVGFQCGSTEMTSARLYIQRSDWDNAIRNLETELAKNPNNEEAWYLLGRVKGEKTDFKGMNDAFDHALKIGQTYAKDIHDVRYNYWGKYINIGVESFNKAKDSAQYYDKAVAAFQTAIVINPDSAAAYKNLGFCYLSKNDMASALEALEKSFALSNDHASGRYVGEINYQLGQSHRDKFETPENKIEIKIWMTPDEVKTKLGEPTSKSTTKDKKITNEKWVYADKKLTLSFEDGQLRSWEENGKKEEKEPKVYYKDYAERDSAMRYYDRAIDVLERVLKLDPHNADLIGLLSNVYIAANKGETALEVFKKGVEADPKNKFFHYNYGVLLLKDNQFENALGQFSAALAIDSTYESALYNLGVGYVNWGVRIRESSPDPAKVETAYKEKFKLGLPYLERLTRMKPEDPEAWELVGKVYANLGKSKEATAVFEKADMLRKKK